MEYLLANDSKEHEIGNPGRNIVHKCVKNCYADPRQKVVTPEILLQFGASVDDINPYVMYDLIEMIESEVLKLLFREGLDLHRIRQRYPPGNSPIPRATKNPDLGVLHALLNEGVGRIVDLHHSGYLLPHSAVRH
ncbi:hypothetical protein QAD02_016542 [Eretmocerus hayati]|uniref:Uncharacterized protein n=1 Tax=Eretmocerus hayati TaxID=131215 RepID=A0ACC2PAY0_9HYME|nr:hypothetical protein QAD02_016542 [Eretmocerus hayati]